MMRMTLAWMSVLVAAVLVLTAVLHSAEALSRDNLSGASAVSSAVASRESGRLAGLDDAVGSALDRVGDIGVSEASEVVTILSTVDGSLHGVDQHMRRVWTTSTGGPMVSAQNRAQGEAGASIQPEGDLGYEGEGDESDAHDAGRYSVLPATDGSIMYHNHDGMRKTSVTARFLAEQAPFVSNEGLVFTGKRTTKVVGLDLSSGKVLHDFSGKASAGGALQGTEALGGGAKKLPSAVGAGTGAVSRGSAVWFGRVDYSVRAVRSDSGEEQFNLSYSELMPLEQAGLVGAAGSADGRRVGTGKVVGLLGSGASGGRRTGAKLPMLPSPSNTIPKHEAEDWEQEGGQEGEGEGEGRGAVALVSMPDGELYLSDLEGNVLEKIPIGLRSPVINAFNLKKSGKGGSKEVGMDIRSINVHHRMFAAAGVGAGLDGEGEYEKLVLVQPLVDALGDGASGGGGDVPLYVLEVEVIPPPASPKQSPLPGSPADVGVPVGEEGEDQSEGEGEAEGSDSRRQAGNDTSRAGASQQGRGRGRGRGRVRGRGVNSTAVSTKGKAEAQAAAQAQRRPLTRHGSGPAYGHGQKLRYGRGLGRGINPLSAAAKAKEQAAAELAAWEGHPTEWGTGATDTGDTGEGWQSAAAYTEEQGWALLDAEATAEAEAQAEARVPPSERICAAEQGAHYPPLQDGLCSAMGQAFHCSSCGAEQAALSLCAHLPSPPSPASAASTPSVRGPHRLREDVYSGDLFLPSLLSQHLFSGVLPGYKSPLELDAPRRDQGRRRYGYDFDEDDDDFSPGRGPRSSLGERVQLYFAKLAGILEQLLLYAAVTALLAFLSLCWAVYYLRSSKQYAHLLPAKANYPAQLAYSLRLLLDKALEGAGVLPPLMRTASQQRLRSGSGTGFGSAVKPALSQVESVDAQGRRTTQVGQLLVHMDQVLGYGSHGTVVYRGDLHGRPLAVKRILSQFTRSADREISLLMQSDGHPNVVRYYTKEAQADFVYLGLQLCEMSLK
ncbi:hypothetical protein B484DRAFT_158841 [Ochromonadaceae sp. CCMP2298]|nr:hypothetical protein B484DRAFT_158841 [Ochromonadaceae sp. CCMP2298]